MSARGTAVIAACLLVAGCGQAGGHPLETSGPSQPKLRGAVAQAAPPATAIGPSPTPAPAAFPTIAIWPLNGQLIDDQAKANHPAIVVKIDNAPEARPHTGLAKADIVYELKVEGITRFAAIYHSEDADPVGPVRSARSSDIHLVSNLHKPYLIWSGGNPGVTGEVNHAAELGFVWNLSEDATRQHYFRDNKRMAPHNLYARLFNVRNEMSALGSGYQPSPMFAYRNTEEPLPPTAIDAPGMIVNFGGGVRVDYVWDAERNGWDRFQVDERHPKGREAFVDANGGQISPQNVVIMFTQYGVSEVDSRSPKALTVGEGDAVVLTNGKAYVNAHWKRESPLTMPVLTDSAGNQIGLTPGKTWIALPEAGLPGAAPLQPQEAAELLARRA